MYYNCRMFRKRSSSVLKLKKGLRRELRMYHIYQVRSTRNSPSLSQMVKTLGIETPIPATPAGQFPPCHHWLNCHTHDQHALWSRSIQYKYVCMYNIMYIGWYVRTYKQSTVSCFPLQLRALAVMTQVSTTFWTVMRLYRQYYWIVTYICTHTISSVLYGRIFDTLFYIFVAV